MVLGWRSPQLLIKQDSSCFPRKAVPHTKHTACLQVHPQAFLVQKGTPVMPTMLLAGVEGESLQESTETWPRMALPGGATDTTPLPTQVYADMLS